MLATEHPVGRKLDNAFVTPRIVCHRREFTLRGWFTVLEFAHEPPDAAPDPAKSVYRNFRRKIVALPSSWLPTLRFLTAPVSPPALKDDFARRASRFPCYRPLEATALYPRFPYIRALLLHPRTFRCQLPGQQRLHSESQRWPFTGAEIAISQRVCKIQHTRWN